MRRMFPFLILCLICAVSYADNKDWKTLKAFYDYDAYALMETNETQTETDTTDIYQVTFSGYDGTLVPAIFIRPKNNARYPIVVLVHGMGGNKEQMIEKLAKSLTDDGIAVFALDTVYEKRRAKSLSDKGKIYPLSDIFKAGVTDLRRTLDYLKTRQDTDMRKVGILGSHLGAGISIITAGVDKRYQVVVSLFGFDTTKLRAELPIDEMDMGDYIVASNYSAQVSPRSIIFINGEKEKQPIKDLAIKLYDSAKEPKEHNWVNTDCVLSQEVVDSAVEELMKYLKY